MTRPAWVDAELFPFESRFVEVNGARVHYIDEGQGPVVLALHGNPTWSFLYRHIVLGLRERFRCIALDYPGFGLSIPPPGYRFTVAEHVGVVESFIQQLDLRDITLIAQDWGGPIGLCTAQRHPSRFRAFVLGHTWAWPIEDDRRSEIFSKVLGSRLAGGLLVRHADFFVNVFMRLGIRRRRLTSAEWAMYRRPHPTASSRTPVHVLPREILGARELLAETEAGLARLAATPTLFVWGDKDPSFGSTERLRLERMFPNHRTQTLHGASHYIQEDAPDEIVSAIEEWWPSTQSGIERSHHERAEGPTWDAATGS